jgi:hypothetical protein
MKDDYNYTIDNRTSVIPNDIALRNGVTQGIDADSSITYTAFSFYVINYSGFPIDVELSMNLDSLNYNNTSSYHVDDALRIMVIEGEHYLTEETYTIYAKPEKNAEDEAALSADEDLYGKYYTTTDWYSDEIIFKRTNQNGIVNLADGDYVKFTIVMWLEGRDVACSNSIYGEMAKLSMDFVGY